MGEEVIQKTIGEGGAGRGVIQGREGSAFATGSAPETGFGRRSQWPLLERPEREESAAEGRQRGVQEGGRAEDLGQEME